MAIVTAGTYVRPGTYYAGLDMSRPDYLPNGGDGETLLTLASNLIAVRTPEGTDTYFHGSFSWDADGLPYGTITAYDVYATGGPLIYSVAGISLAQNYDIFDPNDYYYYAARQYWFGLVSLLLGGADTIHGGTQNDLLDGWNGNDIIYGNGGDDRISGDSGDDTLDGGAGSDLLLGGVGSDTLRGGPGDDRLDGGAQVDALFGGAGNDTYVLGATLDAVVEYANEGMDTIEAELSLALPDHVENLKLLGSLALNGTGNALANMLLGNSGANVLQGEGGNDTLSGGAGNDTLNGGAGADLLDGGVGTDTVTYAGGTAGVTVWLDQSIAVDPGGEQDVLANIENVIGTDHSDVLIGLSSVANVLTAGGGDDYLFFDALDTISGGPGTDRAVAVGASGVSVNMADLEWLWGTNAGDVANASAQTVTVTIFGLGGNDTLTGGAGADQLYGQDGADTLVGGEGDDWLYIDSADLASGSLQGGGGSDRAASLDGSALSFDLGTSSIEWVWASNFGDNLDGTTQTNALYLFAFDGADTLRGGSGNDNLYGMAGADALHGGSGNDVLYFDSDDTVVDGGADYDTAQVLDYTGVGVTLNLATSQIEAVYASNQSDTLDASAATWAVYMNGYNGDDVMSGGGGDDNIYGGGGADTISGGGGNDFLDGSGGPEVDTLVVSGAQADYVLHYTGGVLSSVQDLVGGRDGWDNVAGFEQIQFADGLIVL